MNTKVIIIASIGNTIDIHKLNKCITYVAAKAKDNKTDIKIINDLNTEDVFKTKYPTNMDNIIAIIKSTLSDTFFIKLLLLEVSIID